MDAIVGTRRVERPGYAWIAVGLQLFTALMAIPVGLQLIANPEGGPLGSQAWIDATPFGSWLVPGLVLLTMNAASASSCRGCPDRRPPSAGALADGCASPSVS